MQLVYKISVITLHANKDPDALVISSDEKRSDILSSKKYTPKLLGNFFSFIPSFFEPTHHYCLCLFIKRYTNLNLETTSL